MGIFSRFEDRMEDTVEGAANKISKAPISPVQIAKKAEKQMRRGTMVGAGKEYAPTLYTILVNPDDDARLFGYYPTLAGETETYLSAKAAQEGLAMDGQPLVRFIVDEKLKHGKFDVIAEAVAAPIIEQLRDEEMERYGIAPRSQGGRAQSARAQSGRNQAPRQGGRRRQAAPMQQPGYGDDFDGYGDYPGYDDYEGNYNDGYSNDAWGGDGYYAPEQQPSPNQRPVRGGKPPLPYVPEDEIDRSIDYGEYTFNSEDFEDYRGGVEDGYDAPVAYNDRAQASEPREQAEIPQNRQSNTVAFTPGKGAGAQRQASPNHRTVRARLIDRTYQRPYDLAGTHITLGRESSNDIAVQDINASRKHAELRLNQRGLWVITDLGSMNGTLVNGVSVASQPLYPGDVVTIGKTEFEFTLV